MTQIWLRSNHRIYVGGIVPAAMVLLCGLMLAGGAAGGRWSGAIRPAGILIALLAVAALTILVRWALLPRIALRRESLLVYLRGSRPIEIPLAIVECFLLGQGPSFLPWWLIPCSESRTVVIRLAESADHWRHVDVHPRLGSWCDGYVTFRGAWCEPLSVEVINRLNRQLADAQRTTPEMVAR